MKKYLYGYNISGEQVISADITDWPKDSIENLKAEIQRGPIGRKLGEINFTETAEHNTSP